MPVWQIKVAATANQPEQNYFTQAANETAALEQVKKNIEIAADAKITVSACIV